jgi:hypothetical protein
VADGRNEKKRTEKSKEPSGVGKKKERQKDKERKKKENCPVYSHTP